MLLNEEEEEEDAEEDADDDEADEGSVTIIVSSSSNPSPKDEMSSLVSGDNAVVTKALCVEDGAFVMCELLRCSPRVVLLLLLLLLLSNEANAEPSRFA